MSARELFEVGMRLLGVWQICYGVEESISLVNYVMKQYASTLYSANYFLAHAIAYFLVGFFFLIFARNVVDAVWAEEPDKEKERTA
jgi:hypothetical protein